MRFPETVTRRNLPHWYMPGAAHFVTYRLHGSLPRAALEEIQSRKEALLNRRPPSEISAAQFREQVHKQLFALYDQLLDQGKDACLCEPRVAAMLRTNLYHHHGAKYHLMAYCVMPNHVHVLLQPTDVATGGSPVESIESGPGGPPVKNIKSATGGPPVESIESDPGGPPVKNIKSATGGPPVATRVGEETDEHSPLARIMHSIKSYTAHEANNILKRSGTFWQAESYDHWVRDEDELERIVDYIAANPLKAGLVERQQDWFWCSCHDRFVMDGAADGWLKW